MTVETNDTVAVLLTHLTLTLEDAAKDVREAGNALRDGRGRSVALGGIAELGELLDEAAAVYKTIRAMHVTSAQKARHSRRAAELAEYRETKEKA